MPDFTPNQHSYFSASKGAGSVVTERENFDSQITLDAVERRVLLSIIPEKNIPRGSVRQNGAAKITFDTFRNRGKS
tara:strand:+ start:331 stop:558 length:228 start_codon:yes stop_codon:yes gene_type:complete